MYCEWLTDFIIKCKCNYICASSTIRQTGGRRKSILVGLKNTFRSILKFGRPQVSRRGVSLGLVGGNQSESREHGSFILFPQRLCRTVRGCCVLTIFMISVIHKVAQEQNTWRLWRCGSKMACLIYLPQPHPFCMNVWGCKHQPQLWFTQSEKNGHIAIVLAKRKALQ